MSNCHIVCNTNIHLILQYCYDILINNIYTQTSVSLKPICLGDLSTICFINVCKYLLKLIHIKQVYSTLSTGR